MCKNIVKKLDYDEAAEHLHELIRTCDAEMLATLYEYTFGTVKECIVDDNEDKLIVTFNENCNSIDSLI